MRIDSYSSSADAVSNQSSTPRADVQESANSAIAGGEDRTTLTSSSSSLDALVSTAMSSPASRQETVASLQQAVSSGQYQLDPAKIADAMLADQ
jgi:flagellar biosynthesis anti-sigma factor FlgM